MAVQVNFPLCTWTQNYCLWVMKAWLKSKIHRLAKRNEEYIIFVKMLLSNWLVFSTVEHCTWASDPWRHSQPSVHWRTEFERGLSTNAAEGSPRWGAILLARDKRKCLCCCYRSVFILRKFYQWSESDWVNLFVLIFVSWKSLALPGCWRFNILFLLLLWRFY